MRLFCLVFCLIFSLDVRANEKIEMPLEVAQILSDYGLCRFELHGQRYECRDLNEDGYWDGVQVSPDFISGAAKFDNTPPAIIASMALTGKSKECISSTPLCEFIGNLDSFTKTTLSGKARISDWERVARLQALSFIYTTDRLIKILEENGIYFNISPVDLLNNKELSIKTIACKLNANICNGKYRTTMERMPSTIMIYHFLRGKFGSTNMLAALRNGIWMTPNDKFIGGITDLEIISVRTGHIRNAQMANGLSMDFYTAIHSHIANQ